MNKQELQQRLDLSNIVKEAYSCITQCKYLISLCRVYLSICKHKYESRRILTYKKKLKSLDDAVRDAERKQDIQAVSEAVKQLKELEKKLRRSEVNCGSYAEFQLEKDKNTPPVSEKDAADKRSKEANYLTNLDAVRAFYDVERWINVYNANVEKIDLYSALLKDSECVGWLQNIQVEVLMLFLDTEYAFEHRNVNALEKCVERMRGLALSAGDMEKGCLERVIALMNMPEDVCGCKQES